MKNLDATNSQSFEQLVLSRDVPVLVDFFADWCGPCKAQTPILESFSSEYKGRVDFVKVDVDQHRDLLKTYNIRSIPTLLLFNKGQQVATHVGMGDRKVIVELLGRVA